MKPEIGKYYINDYGTIVEVRAIAGDVCYVVDGERTISVDEWKRQGFKDYAS